MSVLVPEIAGKRIELVKALAPIGAAIAYLVNPSSPVGLLESNEARRAASALGVQVHFLNASTVVDLDAAFATLANLRVGGPVVAIEAFFDSHRDKLVALSARRGRRGRDLARGGRGHRAPVYIYADRADRTGDAGAS